MKKAIALCLTAAMAASLLAGCGSKTTETTAAAENKTETTTGAAAEEKKDEAAGVVKVIEYDLTDEQYAFGVDKDQPELLDLSQRSRRTEPSMRSAINISVTASRLQ